MGNIETLQRYGKHDKGFGIIDNLSYSYSGNQLQKVTDMADASLTYYGAFHFVDGANDEEEYTYDANGNMTADLNKGIDEIFYNSLNLPDEVRFTSGHKNQYIYDAEGTLTCKYLGIPTNFLFSPMERLNAKDRTWWGVTSRSAYYDNVMYTYSSFFDFTPVTLLIDGGYVSLNGPRPQYHFYVQVHLGNNRVVVDETGKVEEVNHYTPFGALMADRSEPSVQPYKYNGKKLDTDNALNWYYYYYYGARYYDAALGRWLCMDPLAEKYYDVSPYAYCGNNPVKYFDKDGRNPGDFFFTMDAAAYDFGMCYNGNSIIRHREYGSTIYLTVNKQGNIGYSYSVPNIGTDDESVVVSPAPAWALPVADIHSHANWNPNYESNRFSGLKDEKGHVVEKSREIRKIKTNYDIGFANRTGLYAYLMTPNGSLQRYNPVTGKISIISTQLPSDSHDPDRLNSVPARSKVVLPKHERMPNIIELSKIADVFLQLLLNQKNER